MLSRPDRGIEFSALTSTSFVEKSTFKANRLYRRLPFHLIEQLTIAGDFIVIILSAVCSGVAYQWLFLNTLGDIDTFVAVGGLVFANFIALTSAQQNYRVTNLINLGRQLRYVTLDWCFIFFVLAAVAFALKISGNISRGSTISFLGFGYFSLLAFRIALATYLKQSLAKGAFAQQRVILITEKGEPSASQALVELSKCGYFAVKTFEISSADIREKGQNASLNRKVETIISSIRGEDVDYIFVLLKWERQEVINQISRALRAVPIPVHLLPDQNVASFLSARAGNIGTTFTIELQRAPLTAAERRIKRMFDLAVASVMLCALSLVLLITALLIKLDSKGPVLFKQRRNGFNGSTFFIYKFRSMRVLEDGNTIRQASRDDPRVTRLGRWLRRTSIDELPQLFNVLRGDMSIVGPRPHAIAHNNEYKTLVSNYAFRHHVKPGITGWAQIKGFRGETRTVDLMARRVEFDLWYINHWSIWLDLRILLKTVLVAYRQPRAY